MVAGVRRSGIWAVAEAGVAMNLHYTMFVAAMVMLVLTTVLGLAAVWVPDFWRHDAGPKTMWTAIVLFAVTVAAAAITKWLG